jgi:hypothetical protein
VIAATKCFPFTFGGTFNLDTDFLSPDFGNGYWKDASLSLSLDSLVSAIWFASLFGFRHLDALHLDP